MEIESLLKVMADKKASDLYLTVGAPPQIKIEGVVSPIGDKVLAPMLVQKLAYNMVSDEQKANFERDLELDFAISIKNVGRFRINLFKQRGEVAIVIRYISDIIPTIEALNLPEVLKELILKPRGLILVVGSTGSGKSTTLASMIDYRNANKTGHILTIEDPVEYLYEHKKSIVSQREVGIDTHSFSNALVRAMREAPDVILIGEIRDRETMQQAISYAETGHLCLSTLHASNANQALERIINFFPETAHHQLYLDLSLHLNAIVSQRLMPGLDQKRVPAVEVMLVTPFISELIEKGEVGAIKDAMAQSSGLGMETFDQALYQLYHSGKISLEMALEHADSKNNLGLKIRMEAGDNPGAVDGLSFD